MDTATVCQLLPVVMNDENVPKKQVGQVRLPEKGRFDGAALGHVRAFFGHTLA